MAFCRQLRATLAVDTINREIEFDPRKNALNIRDHGMSLDDARQFEWGSAVVWMDLREDYGEERMVALGYIGNRLCYMVFVERRGICRVVSLRRANRREVRHYAET